MSIAKHVHNVIAKMTKRDQTKNLYREVIEEMELEHLHKLILHAFVFGDHLVVINKARREIRVRFNQIPALRAIRECDRKHFTIQDNGSCLHWEHSDTHLDFESLLFESLLYCVDDVFRAQCDEQKADYYKEYGKAIAIVRTVYQGEYKGIAGLKTEDVEDIESGKLHPSIMALTCYAKELGLELNEFLDKVAANVDVLKAMEGK